ncbi:FliH/SctL family protein [Pelagibacterium lentulum]|uniref:Flagellar assembly protein FliH n=1 Tax=Pelagibacterium lentulum TaxID=2029865 RepID=A0A916RIQ0_9HYPH|nr:FliH/SctL family protein [Pelagibacterium lentulum]GGA57569.1 flagellar assembly protein FliH [Pelagibacterium lentulum]
MSAAPARFTFDLDLAAPQRKMRSIPEDEVNLMLAHARASSYNDGLRDGQSSIEARAADTLAESANQLMDKLGDTVETLARRQRQYLEDAVTLSATIARKLAAHLVARQPAAEMTALIEECMTSLDHAPHLVIRCHPELCDAMKDAAEAHMTSTGFTGRLVVMGDPEIHLGDGRLEWVDGGLVRDINTISDEINARIAAYLAAHDAKTE